MTDSDIIISVENLSKRYRLGVIGVTSLRESAERLCHKLMGRNPDIEMALVENKPSDIASCSAGVSAEDVKGSADSENIWALHNISLEVKKGEILGVIGRNGAGKSTLLKILTRITEPTTGRAVMRGRVASLLEVGTGFHPELTGRENVYLNGAILGMKKVEIEHKFDDIVAFAEVEKFIDTPVKRYSSGMYVRLAFAVAAHLEPEILLVDEVLAVGDASFQKKCLGKMGDVAKAGRTVLFVSHNMTAVKALCNRAILLHEGRLVCDDIPARTVTFYLDFGRVSSAESIWKDKNSAPGNDSFCIHSVRVLSLSGKVSTDFDIKDSFDIEIQYWTLKNNSRAGTTVNLINADDVWVFSSINNRDSEWYGKKRQKGLYKSTCHIQGNLLAEGKYKIGILIWGDNYSSAYKEDEIVEFEIHDTGDMRGDYFGSWPGVVRPLLEWTTEPGDESL